MVASPPPEIAISAAHPSLPLQRRDPKWSLPSFLLGGLKRPRSNVTAEWRAEVLATGGPGNRLATLVVQTGYTGAGFFVRVAGWVEFQRYARPAEARPETRS